MDHYTVGRATRTDAHGARAGWVVERHGRYYISHASILYSSRAAAEAEAVRLAEQDKAIISATPL